ncbi:PREDICTED: Krueppel-like factor 5 [Rhagoletis zephyria]|uniref:Krueppel-like factor 5 n=1 Tax=Rhagoletis zephyria TaxID=28612 RepID=UPI00081184B7|nr:PREDICTED: Krueppel-like factor 5 [Rhagoletis zephyria]
MLSFSSHLALSNPSMFHSYVDSFFEGKKALVKERLMDSVRIIVDGLFEEMVGQVKEMMMPKERAGVADQVKTPIYASNALVKPSTSKSPMNTQPVPSFQPPKSKMIFAANSKPVPSSSSSVPLSRPFSGLYKRMAENDGSYNSRPDKKKAVTVELQIDGPLDDEEDDYADVALNDSSYGGDIELTNNSSSALLDSIDIANIRIQSTSNQQPTSSGKHPCTEPNCGKHFISNADLKRHLRTHTKVKPFGCTFPGCSKEFALRHHAIGHILSMHLKKKKKGKPGEEEDANDDDEPANPAAYFSVKEELL